MFQWFVVLARVLACLAAAASLFLNGCRRVLDAPSPPTQCPSLSRGKTDQSRQFYSRRVVTSPNHGHCYKYWHAASRMDLSRVFL